MRWQIGFERQPGAAARSALDCGSHAAALPSKAGAWLRHSKARAHRPHSKGILLILVAGTLVLLASLAAAFYSQMRSAGVSSTQYTDAFRAELLVRAGMHDGVARLRQAAFLSTESCADNWYPVDWFNGAQRHASFLYGNGRDDDNDGIVDNELGEQPKAYSRPLGSSVSPSSDRYTLEVEDAASKININAGDNLAVVLDNLCRLIGPPLVAADEDMLQPRRWYDEGVTESTLMYWANSRDSAQNRRLCFELDQPDKSAPPDELKDKGRPVQRDKTPYAAILAAASKPRDGTAVFGDGYAIAGFRSRKGPLNSIEEVKQALTFVDRNANGVPDHPLERTEIEAKYAALKPYITLYSWVDTQTVCVGKFEWVSDYVAIPKVMNLLTKQLQSNVQCQVLMDRDKSWIADDPVNDPKNRRGSLRGSYVSIMNGHGAGQLRRIATNGADWVALRLEEKMEVAPGPISSYMIIAREDAQLEQLTGGDGTSCLLPKTNSLTGELMDDPDIDYAQWPLCIHRSPVNINTASDKVLAALFLGINMQHGHPMALGRGGDAELARKQWFVDDTHKQEPYLLTMRGMKRLPVSSGKLVFDRPAPTTDARLSYLNNYGTVSGAKLVSEAHELACRVILARQLDPGRPTYKWLDPDTGTPVATSGLPRGPFRTWDDLYFRVVHPWDELRTTQRGNTVVALAKMLMANFNSNTDILKFNPNIEWIDRWGRNYTELEPIMVYSGSALSSTPLWITSLSPKSAELGWGDAGAYIIRSLRFKSTDLIDKTDLNRSTTEFSFHSNGIFEVACTAQVVSSARGTVLSERRAEATIKVYDVWRESTQSQFVRGFISNAENQALTWVPTTADNPGSRSGRVARDAALFSQRYGLGRKALDTLPEPLAPLDYRIAHSGRNRDMVGGAEYDAFLIKKLGGSTSIPDAVANRILPAAYDGQIVLATNTASYDKAAGKEQNTFLASFDGDVDTANCRGNGREQAKTPKNSKIRTVDTIGLLGRLNDKEIDFDPGLHVDTFAVTATSQAMKPLNEKSPYWENVMCRMGDLRPEGVFLGNVGVAQKDASMKFLAHSSGQDYMNYDPRFAKGGTVCMWFKPTWHCQDSREHEFFSATNKGAGYGARYHLLNKPGRFTAATWEEGWRGGRLFRENSLNWAMEDSGDGDIKMYIHGGTANVRADQPLRESPAYRTQPFRWSFVGGMPSYDKQWGTSPGQHEAGWFFGGNFTGVLEELRVLARPFIDTARYPEGPGYGFDESNPAREFTGWDNWCRFFHCEGSRTKFGTCDTASKNYQPAAWDYQVGAYNEPVFGSNATNGSGTSGDKKVEWVYRTLPIDGTMSVLDEYKLSMRRWTTDEIYLAMTTSRYYLPKSPTARSQCPTFTSQSLFESLKGQKAVTASQLVTPARVTWTVFTPRFMHENKANGKAAYKRKEVVAGAATDMPFRGPFDYIQYNLDIIQGRTRGEEKLNPPKSWLGVERPPPTEYEKQLLGQSHATRGVEVELVQGATAESVTLIGGKTFTNPDAINAIGSRTQRITAQASRLRYRVRFRYPVDQLVDKGKGLAADGYYHADPANHYLLDTPVFDDVSVTYFTPPMNLNYRDVNE